MSERFADIAFPTAVRRLFTYSVPDQLSLNPGCRVWAPLRSEIAIGMVVRIHENRPGFKTRPVVAPIDREPRLSQSLLELADWTNKFYYSSLGEVIQAALPAGMGFQSEKYVRVAGMPLPDINDQGQPRDHKSSGKQDGPEQLPDGVIRLLESLERDERELAEDVIQSHPTLGEARRRWRGNGPGKRLNKLIRDGKLEVWNLPRPLASEQLVKWWDWADGIDRAMVDSVIEEHANRKWVRGLDILRNRSLPAAQTDLLDVEGLTPYVLRRIGEEGLITPEKRPNRQLEKGWGSVNPAVLKTLSEEQERASSEIRKSIEKAEYSSFLLYGVTGSGKTEIYIHALKQALERGRGGMVLVPEIALTPQTIRRFYTIFGRQIAVLHSRMNERERAEEWERLHSGESRIVIGPRSAVFAPVRKLGLIVVDEEHDGSYKQFDPSPRYHARDVAIMRGVQERAVVVLGSATPSMGSLYGARRGKHTLLELGRRPVGSMPEVKRLDLKQYSGAMRGPLTVELHDAIQTALGQEEQVILLYNRRGFASYLICEECGHIPVSPHASVSLTWHKRKDLLLCHYSGYARKTDKVCESCGSERLTGMGSGTQQIEDEIGQLFPEARLLRMDRDTTGGKNSHRDIYEAFLNREADILIGTQLVSKGLDFPNVTVVGVLNAETELAFPSFRSSERTFQLLSQVSGRAGRSSLGGKVYVQTWRPDQRAIAHAATHNYSGFADEELVERKQLSFPPFSRLIQFRIKGREAAMTEQVASTFTDTVREVTSPAAVMGPSPAVIERLHGLWQWESTLKLQPGRGADQIESILDLIFDRYHQVRREGTGNVRINVDVDAIE